ncbi:MAG: hypothetical protein P1S46_11500 [bacterium]|nr:hypothetical protein [bacterium]
MPETLELNPAELLGLAMCVLVLIYLLVNWRILAGGRYAPVLYAFLCVLGAFVSTTLEEFFLGDLFNIIEHSLMASGAILVTVGCRRALDVEPMDDWTA